MDNKLNLDRSQEEADKLNLLFALLSKLDVEYLKQAYERMENDFSIYQAIGIMDGSEYINKLDDMKARLKRFEAVINLFIAFDETREDIDTIGMKV